MQALGLIETRGLLAAIECADVMLKTAQVELVGRTLVGGGLVTIAVRGDVAAVESAVAAGVTAAKKINNLSIISQHIIPRPHAEIEPIIAVRANLVQEKIRSYSPEAAGLLPSLMNCTGKEEVDAFVRKFGLEESLQALKALSLVKLRKLIREYKELAGLGSALNKAGKDSLLQTLKRYYEKENSP